MKKLVLLMILCSWVGVNLDAAHLRIIHPNTTTPMEIRSGQTISWDYSDLSGDIRLILLRNGSRVGRIVANIPIANRSYSWSAGQHEGGYATAGAGYRIMIRSIGSDFTDESDAPFNLTPWSVTLPGESTAVQELRPRFESPVTVTYPNGGEILQRGNRYEIRWQARGDFGRPRIKIKRGSTTVKTYQPDQVFALCRGDNCTWSWTIGSDIRPGSNYKVRIENALGRLADESDNTFTISESSNIVVTDPRIGALYLTNRNHIRWRAAGVDTNLRILLQREDESTTYIIKTNLSSDTNRYFWTVGDFERNGIGFMALATREHRYKFVVEASDGSVRGELGPRYLLMPSLQVLEPHEGQTIHRGDRINIRWNNSGQFHGNVDVEAWVNWDGSSYRLADRLFTNIRNLKSVSWHVYPKPGAMEGEIDPPPVNKRYKIRIVSSRCPDIFAESGSFTLRR